jgi:protein gp37
MIKQKPTGISWTDFTTNPVYAVRKDNGKRGWFCTKVSEGCRECYAERLNLVYGTGLDFSAQNEGLFDVVVDEKEIHKILNARMAAADPGRRPICFPLDMTDIGHHLVPDEVVLRLLGCFAARADVTWLVLTKRPERLARLFMRQEFRPEQKRLSQFATVELEPGHSFCFMTADIGSCRVPPNIILGTSPCDQKTADKLRPWMLDLTVMGWQTWVSYEPALGAVDWQGWEFIKYMVSGGESGPRARPSHPQWHRDTRDWCFRAGHDRQPNGVPYHFKQHGEWQPVCALYGDPERDHKENGRGELDAVSMSGEIVEDRQPPAGTWLMERVGKKAAGRLLDGVEHNGYPEQARITSPTTGTGTGQGDAQATD